MKNITLSADDHVIEAARERARSENTTLNEQFRVWLESYAREALVRRFHETMNELQRTHSTGGRKFTRDEMNERR